MKSARNTLPAAPPNGVTCGIDWARDDHAVSIVDDRGREIVRSTVEHNAAGLRELLAVLARAGVREVAIERPDGPVVDTLLDAGVTVVVISPNQVKNLRGRYGSAGNKDDRFDAFVLADTLRTDRARLHPLLPDTPATVTLRQTCRARKDLVAHRVAVANQLRAHLKIVFPGAVGLFADLDSQISLAFLTRFDCQDRADWLSVKRLAAWLASVGYSGRTDPSMLYRRLTSAPRGTAGTDGTATTGAFVAVLCSLVAQIKALDADIAEQLARHADAQIFTSLPRSGTFRAARLLAEIGDCRSPLSHPGIVGLPGRSRALHPPIRQSQTRRIPLGRRQTTPRRGHRLRRRQQTRQPLGCRRLQPRHRPRTRPPPRSSHPRPRLALRHLALLARRSRLRPRQSPRPPDTAQPSPTPGGLTQGNSCSSDLTGSVGAFSAHDSLASFAHGGSAFRNATG